MAFFSLAEVAKHNKLGDLWCVIDGRVFDLSKFGALHPGGLPPLLDPAVAGKDATDLFYGLHRASVLQETKYAKLQIGLLEPSQDKDTSKKKRAANTTVPYGEAMGTWRKHSPYYGESHTQLRSSVKAFMDREVAPSAKEWDDDGELATRELDLLCGQAGIFAALVAKEEDADAMFHEYGIALPGNVRAKDWDYFHGLVLGEELRRGVVGCLGVGDGLYGGMSIGLPPLLKFGSKDMIRKYAIPIIRGQKRICLAISEPYAGSDVAQIRTTAILAPDGRWRVSGVKKWITGGINADYFTTLVRTKEHGLCMMLVERDAEGATVITNRIKTSVSPAAGTSYVILQNAVVPPENVIGQLGKGFHQTMANFNFERWGMIVGGNRHARTVVEESMKWAMQRKVFGKPLIQQAVIRYKLAEMIAAVESVHSLLEDVTYQMCKMNQDEINQYLAGPIALLKYKQTRAATLVSDNACQVWGGRALTGTGMGYIIEKFQKSFKFQAILGGSEEILADFAIRQAVRGFKDLNARL